MFVPKQSNPLVAAALTLMASAFVAGTTLLAEMLAADLLWPPLNPLQISEGRFGFAAKTASGLQPVTPSEK